MSGRTKAAIGLALAVACGAAIGAGLAAREEPWPPEWYVDPATNGAEHAALRRQAIAQAETGVPPRKATLEYLRMLAVGAASDPGEGRPTVARVYYSTAGYILALRGRFSTAGISPPPGARRSIPSFAPCVTLILDSTTFMATSTAIGKCEDLSPLGESIELDLDQEPA